MRYLLLSIFTILPLLGSPTFDYLSEGLSLEYRPGAIKVFKKLYDITDKELKNMLLLEKNLKFVRENEIDWVEDEYYNGLQTGKDFEKYYEYHTYYLDWIVETPNGTEKRVRGVINYSMTVKKIKNVVPLIDQLKDLVGIEIQRPAPPPVPIFEAYSFNSWVEEYDTKIKIIDSLDYKRSEFENSYSAMLRTKSLCYKMTLPQLEEIGVSNELNLPTI